MTGQSYRRDQVVNIINSVIHKVNKPQESSREMICNELQDLKTIMEDLRYQLSIASADDVHLQHIPSATDELDAVAGATESATMTIMNACEQILDGVKSASAEMADRIESEVTRIYEACTFQDIAGQRIGKVVRTLKTIDSKVTSLLAAVEKFGDSEIATAPVVYPAATGLLNGPALPRQALSQEEIDRLLEGL